MIRQRHFHPISLLTLLLLLVSLSGCGLLGGNRMDCKADLLATLKIQAPASAKITSESCSSGINPTYRATYMITPPDLEAFERATQVTDWQTNAGKAVAFKDKATSMQSLLFGRFGDGNYIEEVLIDTSNSQQYTVYFERVYVD
jgi:hypothetical protein